MALAWGWLLDLFEVMAFALLASAFLTVLFGPPGSLLRFLSHWRSGGARRAVSEDARQAARGVADTMRRLARPTLLLVPADAAVFSKLGGAPELPDDVEWPGGELSRLDFLGQIDLAALQAHRAIDWLPAEGRLYAFCDRESLGSPDAVQVVYSRAEPGPARAAAAGSTFRERRVASVSRTSLPSTDWLNVDEAALSHDPLDWATVKDLGDAPPPDDLQHRIGGYPNEIQMECMPLSCEHLARGLPAPEYGAEVPPAVARASKAWRLLLQIDSDPALGMNWGDGGRIYVFIKERHARASDFSKIVSLWQTY